MSLSQEVRTRMGSLIGKLRLAPVPQPDFTGMGQELAPKSTDEIPWDKFRRYLAPLPDSITKFKPESMTFGDIYTTGRVSGKDLTILPIHIDSWKRKRSQVDMLLILGFNSQMNIIGMRTMAIDLTNVDFIHSEGAIATAICNDGIGSALEQVRDRVSRELLVMYRQGGYSAKEWSHHVDDENIRILHSLKGKHLEEPADELMRQRYEHAVEDRPRWESLFSADRSGGPVGSIIRITPDDTLVRGFSSEFKTAYGITRATEASKTIWMYEDSGATAREEYAKKGMFSKDFIQGALHKTAEHPPED